MRREDKATQTPNQSYVKEDKFTITNLYFSVKINRGCYTIELGKRAHDFLYSLTTESNLEKKCKLIASLASYFDSVPDTLTFSFPNFQPLAGIVLTQLPTFRNNLNDNYIKYSYNLFADSYKILVRVMSDEKFQRVSKDPTIQANIVLIELYQKAIAQDKSTRGIIYGPR